MDRKIRSFTLVELILTILLLSVIILAATSFDYTSLFLFESSRKKSVIINEMSLVLDHIHKSAIHITGDVNDSGINVDSGNQAVNLRVDVNDTPCDYSDDIWVRYECTNVNSNQYKIDFCSDASSPSSCYTLTKKVVKKDGNLFRFDKISPNEFSCSNLALRYDPTKNMHIRKNPEVYMPEAVIFSSISHSIN